MPWRSTSSAIEASRHDFMRPKLWMVMLFLGVLVAHGLPFHHHVLSSDLYLPLHAAMETLSVAVSLMIFMLIWSSWHHRSGQELWLGVVFLSAAIYDFFHTFSFPGMLDMGSSASVEKGIYFWLLARYSLAIGLVVFLLLPIKRISKLSAVVFLIGTVLLAALMVWLGLWHLEWFPATHVVGEGLTSFKITLEYGLMALYVALAGLFYQRMKAHPSERFEWLVVALLTMAMSEYFFTRYASANDLFNVMGHVYKVIAVGFVYYALTHRFVTAPYREVEVERAKLKFIFDAMSDPVWVKDAKGQYLACNPAFERLWGRSDIVGLFDVDLTDSEKATAFRADDQRAMAAQGPLVVQEWVTLHDGQQCLLSTTKTALRDTNGTPLMVLGSARDVSEFDAVQQDLENRLKELKLAKKVFESAGDSILVTDAQRKIVAVNPAFENMTGYTEAEVLGQTPAFLHSGRHAAGYYKELWHAVSTMGYWQGELWNRRKSGDVYPVLENIVTLYDDDGQVSHYLGIASDISYQKEAELKLNFLAFHDTLTGLPNKALLKRQFETITQAQDVTCAVVFLDLDNFKQVNDALGHNAGDQLLIEFVQRLSTFVRSTDVIARLGGDEFVLLLPNRESADIHLFMMTMMAGVAQPIHIQNHAIGSTVSIGVSHYPQDGSSLDELLKYADVAMYASKKAGRNAYHFYDASMGVAAAEALTLMSSLRQGIQEQQLRLFLQPKVDLSSGVLTGAEALVRWQHPSLGLLMPDAFLPMVEGSDVMLLIGEWMLDAACKHSAFCRDQSLPMLPIAVNLAAQHFRISGLGSYISALLRQYALGPDVLELELTESSFLDLNETVLNTLTDLRARGIRLSVDDFGTGYSSLSYLRRLPINSVKIDRSFVRDLVEDKEDRTIAAAIVSMAHSLGLKVVAEGVETEAQRAILMTQGCDQAQGYLYAKPMAIQDFQDWCKCYQEGFSDGDVV